jgi:hypothetical protein
MTLCAWCGRLLLDSTAARFNRWFCDDDCAYAWIWLVLSMCRDRRIQL